MNLKRLWIITLILLGQGIFLFGDSITLEWDKGSERDLAGYNIYRSTSLEGPFSKVNKSLIQGSSFEDSSAEKGAVYYYTCAAVSSSGLESAFSNVVAGEVPSVCAGDADLSGTRTIIDAVRILNFITGNLNLTTDESKAADFNGNGIVDVLDAVGLMNALVGNLELPSCQ